MRRQRRRELADKITLWGRANSANVQKAVWALEELNLDYDHREVGGKFGGLDTREFGELNPNKTVPVLQHDDLIIWESHTIIRYLAATFSNAEMWPGNPRARAIADQWTDWTATIFQPAWIAVFYLIVRTPPSKHDQAAIRAATAKTNTLFSIMDRQLEAQPFLAGDVLTYADIAAGTALYRWMSMDVERISMPNVIAWHERLLKRDAFVKGVCVSYDDLFSRETP